MRPSKKELNVVTGIMLVAAACASTYAWGKHDGGRAESPELRKYVIRLVAAYEAERAINFKLDCGMHHGRLINASSVDSLGCILPKAPHDTLVDSTHAPTPGALKHD